MNPFALGPVLGLVVWLTALWAFSRAAARAGYSSWWALLGLFPPVGVVLLWVFAFSRWPALPET